ncbi:MAG TPA: multiheme c-type cytochrome [Planctomycetaceae bacterium]|nr:multiheme c-type cytochrome [Planctomycetaceae bacterium]
MLLYVVFALAALLGANSLYLSGVTVLDFVTGRTYENWFYQFMFLGHIVLGLLLVLPFLVFGLVHLRNSSGRRNRRAVRVGYALFAASIVVLATGILLLRVGLFELKLPSARSSVYWAHVLSPLTVGWLYWLHRLAGPRIKWRIGLTYLGVVGAAAAAMVFLHAHDPRQWHVVGPEAGTKYFEPSLARTATGKFIPAEALMMDDYCIKCHADVHAGWSQSAHRFSSFNNPAYLASVRETRAVSLRRDGNVQASRWCAGCHDPAPFFSGAFDDPKFDDVRHPTAHAGIGCTVCHAITHVNSTRGNADYTIEEPQHYPFAFSDNAALQWVNRQLVKAKPSFHKKTFLKEFHKTAEFCSTCHKVHIPYELNNYKEFLRGQNHYDPFLLSGVSGHGARSFYYPPKAQANCNGCHMPFVASDDFSAKVFPGAEKPSIHNHLFPAANTGIAWLKDAPEALAAHQEFLKGTMRVDLFGIRDGKTVDGKLQAPLRPAIPTLIPGETYLLETVIRTLKLGHLFTQGTADSNEVWLDIVVKCGERLIGRSGAIDDSGQVDPWAHFVNLFMLDKDGNRIARRNPQDIFVPLYNHQIPPGAAQSVHYELVVPAGVTAPITVEVRLQYRKFDQTYMDFVTSSAKEGDLPIRDHQRGQAYVNPLPITTLAVDRLTFPVAGTAEPVPPAVIETSAASPQTDFPLWQRWNDYGIGLLLKGKSELRQAGEAFQKVEELKRFDGPLNLARALYAEGRLDEAVEAIRRAAAHTAPAAPPWTLAWLSGLVNREQGRLEQAEQNLRSVLSPPTAEMLERGFDFRLDYEVINLLGQTLFDRARQERGPDREAARRTLLEQAVEQFERTLALESENVAAHYNLQLLYAQLGQTEKSETHRRLHARYKPDDNAAGRAQRLARERYPAANHAAEAVVIYPLQRAGAPGLTETAARTPSSSPGDSE